MSYRTNKIVDDTPTSEVHIPSVIVRSDCVKHGAEFNQPCYSYPALDGSNTHTGICNSRARKAGMTGRINPTSLDRSLAKNFRA